METKIQRETTQKAQELRELRELRELKLERILLYSKWVNRPAEEKHLDWEHWMLLRKLRRESEETREKKSRPSINESINELMNGDYVYTYFGVQVKKHSWLSDVEFKKYVERLNKEHIKLQKYNTKTLLYNYKKRFYSYSCECSGYTEIFLEGVCYLPESFKYILDGREHIERKKKKKNFQGKKDKKNGRKNPTKHR